MSDKQTLKNNAFEKEPVLFSLKEDVAKYGADCAIMLYNIRHWCAHNKANNRNYYDGRYWTFNSMSAFSELFCFWSPKQIRRILDTLVAKGAIVKGNYNTSRFDRTLWYAIKDNKVANKNDECCNQTDETGSQNNEIQTPRMGKPICPNGQTHLPQMGKPIPDINTDNKLTDNNPPTLRNTIPYGNTITSYYPQGGNKPVSPCGDILGDKRPDGANDLPSPKKTTKPEDYGLVKFDISEIEFGDYERLVNWFEYNHREKSTGKVMRPYCKKMFKQMVNQAKEFANGIWFKAVDCIEAAVNNNYQGFGKAECGFYVKPKTDEDYELEESLARDYRTHPQDMPERIMRYKPMVLDLALDYCNEQIGKLQGWKSEEKASMNGLDPQNPSYERLRGYALEKIANYDRVITEYVNQIKWVEGEKNSLKTKRTC